MRLAARISLVLWVMVLIGGSLYGDAQPGLDAIGIVLVTIGGVGLIGALGGALGLLSSHTQAERNLWLGWTATNLAALLVLGSLAGLRVA